MTEPKAFSEEELAELKQDRVDSAPGLWSDETIDGLLATLAERDARIAELERERDAAKEQWWKVRAFRQEIAPEICGGTDFWDSHTPREIGNEATRRRNETIDAITSIVKEQRDAALAQVAALRAGLENLVRGCNCWCLPDAKCAHCVAIDLLNEPDTAAAAREHDERVRLQERERILKSEQVSPEFLEEVRAEEREACAKLADQCAQNHGDPEHECCGIGIALEARARGAGERT